MKNGKNALSEEKLRNIEKRLADMIAEFGYLKGRSAKVTKALAYIYIRGEVTQQLLRELTGYSLGTISTALQDLEKLNIVSKNPVPYSRQYSYKINGTLSEVLSRSMTGFPVYLSQVSEFLKEIETKLNKPSLSNKQGHKEIRQFLDEMTVLIPAYRQVLQKFQIINPLAGEKKAGETSDA
jgi:DNA-binding transcriptional regulator GbsR (MarR family)